MALLETPQLRRLRSAALDVVINSRPGVAAAGGGTTSDTCQLLQDQGPDAVAAVLRECVDDIRAVVACDSELDALFLDDAAAAGRYVLCTTPY